MSTPANNNTKMKGLLKGLRYISQIFDNEKEPEMKIGLPTDVKHVAHIGWDGPSVNSAPSWMNEFKSASGGGFSSAPLADNGREVVEEDSIKWVSQDGMSRESSRSQNAGEEVSKSSRSSSRRSTSSTNGESSMNKERTSTDRDHRDRGRQSRKSSSKSSSSKDINSDGAIHKPVRKPKQQADPNSSDTTTADSSAGVPKKSGRKKKLKDKLGSEDVGGSSRLSLELDVVSDSESRFSNASGFDDN